MACIYIHVLMVVCCTVFYRLTSGGRHGGGFVAAGCTRVCHDSLCLVRPAAMESLSWRQPFYSIIECMYALPLYWMYILSHMVPSQKWPNKDDQTIKHKENGLSEFWDNSNEYCGGGVSEDRFGLQSRIFRLEPKFCQKSIPQSKVGLQTKQNKTKRKKKQKQKKHPWTNWNVSKLSTIFLEPHSKYTALLISHPSNAHTQMSPGLGSNTHSPQNTNTPFSIK